MHVAVIIVGFRNAADIVRCVSALETSTHTDFEVLICENGGSEAYERVITSVPARLTTGQEIRVVLAPGNLGFAGGVNVGFRETPDADAWWVLNPDTVPAPGALAALVERLERGDCDAVGGVLHRENGTVQCYGGLWRGWLARAESIGINVPLDTPVDAAAVERAQNYLNGASMLISRRFVETAGLMREEYFLYCEEVEWCLRALGRGLRLGFAPMARVLHAQGATTGAAARIHERPRLPIYLDERNKMLLTHDIYPARRAVAAVAALVLIGLRFGPKRAWRQLGYGVSGWWAGLRGERGPPAWLDVR